MRYKNHTVICTRKRMINPGGSVGNRLYEIEGQFKKDATTRPFITSLDSARNWINAGIEAARLTERSK